MFGNNDKLTFGYFSKRIAKSDPEDTKSLFFYDIESNTKRFQNIVQRGFSFIYFFNSQYLNISKLIKDFDSGWTLRGNIPTGYGIGSSGAVCAAILDKYQYESADIETSHNQLIQMESYFHGKSSGLDPLVSFYDKPVLING